MKIATKRHRNHKKHFNWFVFFVIFCGYVWAQKPVPEFLPPASNITFATRLDRTAVWAGDQFHYLIIVDYPPDYEFVLDNLTKETVNMDPFQVIDVSKNLIVEVLSAGLILREHSSNVGRREATLDATTTLENKLRVGSDALCYRWKLIAFSKLLELCAQTSLDC